MATEELAGSPRYRLDTHDYFNDSIVREYICDWSEVGEVVQELYQSTAKTPTDVILVPTDIRVEPYSSGSAICPPTGVDSDGYAQYNKAKVTVFYTGYTVAISGQQYLTGWSESIDTASLGVNIPTAGLVYFGTLKSVYAENQFLPVRIPIVEYRVTVKKYGTVPPAAISMLGSINSVPFFTKRLGLAFAPYKVMYTGHNYAHNHVPALSPIVYTCTFMIHPISWIHVFSPSLNSWRRISTVGGTVVTPYPLADLNAVLI